MQKQKIQVKPEHKSKVFGFNNSAKPLGQRDDLHLLYNDAKHHNVKYILDLFEPVDEEKVEESKVALFTKKQEQKKQEQQQKEEE